ncbi:hypothetical protein EV193_10843 [Herbihabitans rhizosphaerae]|uniref:HEAT repeat protein n=1 Tax=Herbihabitans rhizosphaerae TaxID=1872711 RepID=A0A4Q7KKB4_9PSEU|nr:hypothetical protein [Herbihabitans rhizosphaerae]RZS34695.1 hypothetical protein EV193_10843 [Herbihabitans rhizosphaerae]
MSARHDAVAALVRLADSPHVPDRADAGRALSSFAEMAEAREPLLTLVLDAHDTFVTEETTEALLRRHDKAGLTVVAAAIGTADENTLDHLHDAVTAVLSIYSRDRDAALRVCQELRDDTDERVRSGADQLIADLTEITPVLVPAGE